MLDMAGIWPTDASSVRIAGGKWIAQLVLPAEVVRWEWKRFRLHYVLVAAQVLMRARQLWVRLLGARSLIDPLLLAFDTL